MLEHEPHLLEERRDDEAGSLDCLLTDAHLEDDLLLLV